MAGTPCSQCRGLGFDPWSGSWTPHAATKSSHVAAKAWDSQINKYSLKNRNMRMPAHKDRNVGLFFHHDTPPVLRTTADT